MAKIASYLFLTAFITLSALVAGPAIAGGESRPALTGNLLEDKKILEAQGWRILDPLGEISTSTCIGDPKTPLCAAETAEYCLLTAHQKICESVGIDVERWFGNRRPGGYSFFEFTALLEIARGVVREPEGLKKRIRMPFLDPKPGDIAIRLRYKSCSPEEKCYRRTSVDRAKICRQLRQCSILPSNEDYVVFVRSNGPSWIVVGIGYYGELPGRLWNQK